MNLRFFSYSSLPYYCTMHWTIVHAILGLGGWWWDDDEEVGFCNKFPFNILPLKKFE